MKTLIIDNYDSFTYNLAQITEQVSGQPPAVISYGKLRDEDLLPYDKIMISPGPGIPEDFPKLEKWIRLFAGEKDILGICLGHEALAIAFGGSIESSGKIFHGIQKKSNFTAKDDVLFRNIPDGYISGLYHSWKINEKTFPSELLITSRAEDGIIMSIRHKKYNLRGLQFHPESIMTPCGEQIIKNWLNPNSSDPKACIYS